MQLNHPNIIKLYDYSFDEVNNNTYVILEYAENGTLFDYIKQNQNKDKDRRHRDIKVQNFYYYLAGKYFVRS